MSFIAREEERTSPQRVPARLHKFPTKLHGAPPPCAIAWPIVFAHVLSFRTGYGGGGGYDDRGGYSGGGGGGYDRY